MNGYLQSKHVSAAFLVGLCTSAASFSALAANEVVVRADATTTFYAHPTAKTFGVNESVAKPDVRTIAVKATDVERYNPASGGAGLQQKMQSGITIEATKQRAPVTSYVRAGAGTLKNAAVSCFRSLKCNLATSAAAMGLQEMLDAVDWVMTDGAIAAKNENAAWQTDNFPTALHGDRYFSASGTDFGRDCSPSPGSVTISCTPRGQYYTQSECIKIRAGYDGYYYVWNGSASGSQCGYTYVSTGSPEPDSWFSPAPIKPEIIQSTDFQNVPYNPHPSDWQPLTEFFDWSAPDLDIFVDPIPSTPPINKQENYFDESNTPKGRTDINIWHDFAVENNPSKQPDIVPVENKKTETFDSQGNKTGSSHETTRHPATSSGSGGNLNVDIPTDCQFFPTLCRWLDWTKEPLPPEEGIDDLELVLIDVRELGRDVEIGQENAGCPEPYILSLGWFPSVTISYEPFCELADIVRPWLIALGYLIAARTFMRNI